MDVINIKHKTDEQSEDVSLITREHSKVTWLPVTSPCFLKAQVPFPGRLTEKSLMFISTRQDASLWLVVTLTHAFASC